MDSTISDKEYAVLAEDIADHLRIAYEAATERANVLHVSDERWSKLNRAKAAVQLGYLLAADIAREAERDLSRGEPNGA